MGVAELRLKLSVTDNDGHMIVDEERFTRWATAGNETWEPVSLPTGAFTPLSPPTKAALLLLTPPRTATLWTLKGAENDTGIALIGARNWGLPILLSLGTSPSIGIRNDGATCTAQALWISSLTQPDNGIVDTFTRANADTLGETEPAGLVVAWEVTAGETWGIRSGAAALTAGFGNTLALLPTDWSDIDFSVTFPAASAQPLDGLAFRCSADEFGDGWLVAGDTDPSTTWRLLTFASGTPTEVEDLSVAPADGDVVRVVAVGDTITVYVNGTQRAIVSNSWQQTATRHGIAQRSGGFFDGRWDDVSIEPAT